jgi:signal peptidase II
VALGLVTAGAIGNLIDRAMVGWVTDFIQIPLNFPVFNVADSSVVVGVGMLVWWLLFGPASAGAADGASEPAPNEESQ